MPESDRVQELRRQRQLLQDHLAWLERELASASMQSASAPPQVPFEPEPLDETTLAGYTPAPAVVREQVRRGCFFYFALALALLSAALLGAYFIWRRL